MDPELFELTTAKLDAGAPSNRVADAFARLMSTMDKTSTATRSELTVQHTIKQNDHPNSQSLNSGSAPLRCVTSYCCHWPTLQVLCFSLNICDILDGKGKGGGGAGGAASWCSMLSHGS